MSGFSDEKGNNEWFVFEEDVHEIEPYRTGIALLTVAQINELFNLNLVEELKKLEDAKNTHRGL